MISPLLLLLAAAPFSSSGPSGDPTWVDAGPDLPGGIAPAAPAAIVARHNGAIGSITPTIMAWTNITDGGGDPEIDLRVDYPDGGCTWVEPFTFINSSGLVEFNVVPCNGAGGLIQSMGGFSPVDGHFTYNGGALYEAWAWANYPATIGVLFGDDTTERATLTAGIDGNEAQTPGLRLVAGGNAYAGIQSQTYGGGPYMYVFDNIRYQVSNGNNNLFDTSKDGWQTRYLADAVTDGITDIFFSAGTNPRTGSPVRSIDKSGNETLLGVLDVGTFTGTTAPLTCAAAWRGAFATMLGNGTSTNDKRCTCVNAAGTYKWVSVDLVTGTITATGNTTTCN